MENDQNAPVKQDNQESIFNEEEFKLQGYNKHIRQARNAIYLAAGILLINLFVLIASNNDNEYLWVDILIWSCFIVGFVFLGIWTKKKPYYAIVGALVLYSAFIALNAFIELKTLYSGLIFKIAIFVFLIKGINDAKEAQEMQGQFPAS
jgi:hypothetical protein